jgi:arginyl-tRNA synthetase
MNDRDPQQALAQRVSTALAAAFGDEYAETDPLVRPSGDARFGDYQINVAMSLAKKLGRKPREVAAEILECIAIDDLCEPPEIAGPGFINCTLSRDYLSAIAESLAADPRLGVEPDEPSETIVVDYSAPNVAKEMHVGHLRSTIIGDALARVFALLGHRVIRQNHVGDWGTQFGMLIEYLDREGESSSAGAGANIADLNRFYQEAKKCFDADAKFADRARRRVVELQSGDPATLATWRRLVEESERHFRRTYDRLRVALTDADIQPESAYNDELPGLVDWLTDRGLTEVSDGALCIFPEGFVTKDGGRLPMIIRKSDGGYLYATTDLAALRHRVETLHADRIVYVTDSRQSQHFAMVFAVAERAGWLAGGTRVEHVPFGTILGEDNRPFKTRSGEVVKLDALLDEADERAVALAAESSAALDPEERATIAARVSIGAVKYADLSSDRVKDYVFSWDRMMAMDGNTAPYLQYAYARIRSLFRRAERSADELAKARVSLDHDKERALFLQLLLLGPTVRGVAGSLEPHRLCTFLYDVASAFSAFYESCPVLRAESDAVVDGRLALCDLTARTLEIGLELLGIEVVERM